MKKSRRIKRMIYWDNKLDRKVKEYTGFTKISLSKYTKGLIIKDLLEKGIL